MPASLLTAKMCVDSAEKSLDTTAFLAIWMVAVEVENNVGVVFQVSMNSRVLFVVPFPTTEALVQSNAWPVARHCRARREFSSVA